MITLELARDKSTYVITCSFYDHTNSPFIPDTIKWSLVDGLGRVVNNREDVVAIPGTSINVVLWGDDLNADLSKQGRVRQLIVRATYDAVIDGSLFLGLTLNDATRFEIENLPVI